MRTLIILVLTQTLSIIGSGVSGLAVGIRVYADTGNAAPLTLVSFFATLPNTLRRGAGGMTQRLSIPMYSGGRTLPMDRATRPGQGIVAGIHHRDWAGGSAATKNVRRSQIAAEYGERGGEVRERSIRVTARCLFRQGGQILTISAQDPGKPEPHYGVPGGGVEFGETSEQALRREMREELGAEIAGLELRAVTEEIYQVLRQTHHEIVFLYEGSFVDPDFYARSVIPYVEGPEPRAQATWMPASVFVLGEKRLVPGQLVEMLQE